MAYVFYSIYVIHSSRQKRSLVFHELPLIHFAVRFKCVSKRLTLLILLLESRTLSAASLEVRRLVHMRDAINAGHNDRRPAAW